MATVAPAGSVAAEVGQLAVDLGGEGVLGEPLADGAGEVERRRTFGQDAAAAVRQEDFEVGHRGLSFSTG